MNLIFFGNGNRGVDCLKFLKSRNYDISLVVAHPGNEHQWYESVEKVATDLGISAIQPKNPNRNEVIKILESFDADVYVLAGYGKILEEKVIQLPKAMVINLHAGKLPQYRGSSPMNWALINGEKHFSLSIISVDPGIDTGDILKESTFPIKSADTIMDLHSVANKKFPKMLSEVLNEIDDGTFIKKKQDETDANYYPLRFPGDGLITWDMQRAGEIHNKIRALTIPYPCAFTFLERRKVNLISSSLDDSNFRGEPGRIYRRESRGLLVCASDKCLWITEAVFSDDNGSVIRNVGKYESFRTVSQSILTENFMTGGKNS